MKGVAVVTGGSKGLGRELVLAFGRAGYFPAALYSADESAAARTRELLAAEGLPGFVAKHDVISSAAELWSRPEIRDASRLVLINNACAAFQPMPMHQLDWTDFERQFAVAVKGAWLCSQALIRPMLRSGGGTIVNLLTAALADLPPKGFAAYVTAKHALRGFTLALAAEYAPRGLRVLSASPGFMDTPLTDAWDARFREAIRAASPRISNPDEAARRLVELVESNAVPGQGEDYPI